MPELKRGAYYMVAEKRTNRVVRLRGIGERVVVLREAEGAGRWTVNRAHFEEQLAAGEIQAVEPQWRPAGEPVMV